MLADMTALAGYKVRRTAVWRIFVSEGYCIRPKVPSAKPFSWREVKENAKMMKLKRKFNDDVPDQWSKASCEHGELGGQDDEEGARVYSEKSTRPARLRARESSWNTFRRQVNRGCGQSNIGRPFVV